MARQSYLKNCFLRLSLAILFLPMASHAAAFGETTALVKESVKVLNAALTVVFILALVVFGWGVVKYIYAAGDANKVKDARGILWWGILGLFVLAAMWGLIKFIASELSVDGPDTQGTIKPLRIMP